MASSSSSSSCENKLPCSGAPVFSREMTLEAHFTFTPPRSVSPSRKVQPRDIPEASAARGSHSVCTPIKGEASRTPLASKEAWEWRGDGAHCFVSCGQRGVTMKYDVTPTQFEDHAMKPETPFSLRNENPDRKRATGEMTTTSETHLEPPSSRDTRPQTPDHVIRPHERRCKTTAQIVLQKAGNPDHRRAREFHGSTPLHNATTYTSKDERSGRPLTQWESAPQKTYPMCSCPHCTTLHTLVASLRQEFPCPCALSPRISTQIPRSSHTFNSHCRYIAAAAGPTSSGRTEKEAAFPRGRTYAEADSDLKGRSPDLTPTEDKQHQFVTRDEFAPTEPRSPRQVNVRSAASWAFSVRAEKIHFLCCFACLSRAAPPCVGSKHYFFFLFTFGNSFIQVLKYRNNLLHEYIF